MKKSSSFKIVSNDIRACLKRKVHAPAPPKEEKIIPLPFNDEDDEDDVDLTPFIEPVKKKIKEETKSTYSFGSDFLDEFLTSLNENQDTPVIDFIHKHEPKKLNEMIGNHDTTINKLKTWITKVRNNEPIPRMCLMHGSFGVGKSLMVKLLGEEVNIKLNVIDGFLDNVKQRSIVKDLIIPTLVSLNECLIVIEAADFFDDVKTFLKECFKPLYSYDKKIPYSGILRSKANYIEKGTKQRKMTNDGSKAYLVSSNNVMKTNPIIFIFNEKTKNFKDLEKQANCFTVHVQPPSETEISKFLSKICLIEQIQSNRLNIPAATAQKIQAFSKMNSMENLSTWHQRCYEQTPDKISRIDKEIESFRSECLRASITPTIPLLISKKCCGDVRKAIIMLEFYLFLAPNYKNDLDRVRAVFDICLYDSFKNDSIQILRTILNMKNTNQLYAVVSDLTSGITPYFNHLVHINLVKYLQNRPLDVYYDVCDSMSQGDIFKARFYETFGDGIQTYVKFFEYEYPLCVAKQNNPTNFNRIDYTSKEASYKGFVIKSELKSISQRLKTNAADFARIFVLKFENYWTNFDKLTKEAKYQEEQVSKMSLVKRLAYTVLLEDAQNEYQKLVSKSTFVVKGTDAETTKCAQFDYIKNKFLFIYAVIGLIPSDLKFFQKFNCKSAIFEQTQIQEFKDKEATFVYQSAFNRLTKMIKKLNEHRYDYNSIDVNTKNDYFGEKKSTCNDMTQNDNFFKNRIII